MGGIQCKQDSQIEVHSIRGDQVIFRAAKNYLNGRQSSSLPVSRQGSVKSLDGGNYSRLRDSDLERSLSTNASRIVWRRFNRCPLMDQTMDILEKILQWLRPRDLALLSLTCKTLNFVVRNYVTHECEKSTLSPQLKRFFEQNKELLLPKEVALLEAVKVNPKPELLLYSTGKQYLGKVQRLPFNEVNHFAHLDKDHLVKKEWDVSLKRNVLVIQQTRTPIHLVHVFKDIRPGQYVIKLRLRLTDSKSAKNLIHQQHRADRNTPASLAVSMVTSDHNQPSWSHSHHSHSCKHWNNSTSAGRDHRVIHSEEPLVRLDKLAPLVKQMIYTKDWLCIWQTQSLDYCAPNFDFVEIKYDRDSDWFFLEVKEFKLEEKCHLQVEFLAEHDYHWKRNMVWDFLELREIQQQAYNPLFKK